MMNPPQPDEADDQHMGATAAPAECPARMRATTRASSARTRSGSA